MSATQESSLPAHCTGSPHQYPSIPLLRSAYTALVDPFSRVEIHETGTASTMGLREDLVMARILESMSRKLTQGLSVVGGGPPVYAGGEEGAGGEEAGGEQDEQGQVRLPSGHSGK